MEKNYVVQFEYPAYGEIEVVSKNAKSAMIKAMKIDEEEGCEVNIDFDMSPVVYVQNEKGETLMQNKPSYNDLVKALKNVVRFVKEEKDENKVMETLRYMGVSKDVVNFVS